MNDYSYRITYLSLMGEVYDYEEDFPDLVTAVKCAETFRGSVFLYRLVGNEAHFLQKWTGTFWQYSGTNGES